MIGNLSLIVGPMFSGKTSALVKKILWVDYIYDGEKLVVYKPKMDTRYSDDEIVTHTEYKFKAVGIERSTEIKQPGVHTYFFDEIQFYDPDVVDVIKDLVENGCDVVAAGLNTDYTGKPFENTASLLAMADHITILTSNCNTCGKPAHKTFKKVASDTQIELGETDLYEARCNEHWHIMKEE